MDFVICFSTDDYADEYDVDDGDLRAPVHAVTYNGVAQLVLEAVREIFVALINILRKRREKKKVLMTT